MALIHKFGPIALLLACLTTLLSSNALAGEVLRDVRYGTGQYQRMDVYLPKDGPDGAPVIFFVHGGGWRFGDKTNSSVIGNKARHWTSEGYVFISANSRLLPEAGPLEQADDVADAIAFAQKHADEWGANPALFILMGHSSGAHLVSLVSVQPDMLKQRGGQPVLATVALDGASYDITQIMRYRHDRFFDYVFGDQPDLWQELSPLDQVSQGAAPMLLVCSEFRSDSCGQATALARRLKAVGARAEVLPVRLSHGSINKRLGTRGDYTAAVDAFMSSLALP